MMKRQQSHISTQMEADLSGLKEQILGMGKLVGDHVAEAVAAMVARDNDRARRAIESDREVNRAELVIDEKCINLLALRQPEASDLRFVAAALKMVTDLERIGDLAVNMAERVETLSLAPPLRALGELPAMAAAAETMLRDVLDAFVNADPAKAESVIAADPRIDAWMRRLFDEIQAEMQRDSNVVARGIATIFFAKHIERIADHATNIAEMVIYLVRGEDVRHPALA